MLNLTTLEILRSAISSQGSVSGHTHSDAVGGQMTVRCGQDLAHANHSVQLDDGGGSIRRSPLVAKVLPAYQ